MRTGCHRRRFFEGWEHSGECPGCLARFGNGAGDGLRIERQGQGTEAGNAVNLGSAVGCNKPTALAPDGCRSGEKPRMVAGWSSDRPATTRGCVDGRGEKPHERRPGHAATCESTGQVRGIEPMPLRWCGRPRRFHGMFQRWNAAPRTHQGHDGRRRPPRRNAGQQTGTPRRPGRRRRKVMEGGAKATSVYQLQPGEFIGSRDRVFSARHEAQGNVRCGLLRQLSASYAL
jgi:hypothetical protein